MSKKHNLVCFLLSLFQWFHYFSVTFFKAANQIDELKASFDAFDADRSGYISSAELKNVVNNLGIAAQDDEFKEILESMDKNDDGSISFAGLILLSRFIYVF